MGFVKWQLHPVEYRRINLASIVLHTVLVINTSAWTIYQNTANARNILDDIINILKTIPNDRDVKEISHPYL